MSPQDETQDYTSVVLALDELTMSDVTFENSFVANKFSNFMQHATVTYPALHLGRINVVVCVDDDSEEEEEHGDDNDEKEEEKIARQRIVSELLIKPSVEQLTLNFGCPIENMNAIDACATVTQIQLASHFAPSDFCPDAVHQKLQTIAMRNRELARFVANPHKYPHNDLLKLMRQFDNSPTGRYMLARCFAEMPSFFKIKSTVSPMAGWKKRTRRD